MNSRILKAVLFLSLILTSPGALQASNDVVVAVVGPMVGTSNAVGMQYKVGVSAALNDLPGMTVLGRGVSISLHDDSCDMSIAEGVAQQLAESPPAVVIGHSCSGATIAAAPLYAEHAILQITPASTSPKVTEMGIATLFRMIGRDDVQGELAAQRIAERHAGQKIGVLSFPGAYSSGLAGTAMAALERRGIVPAVHVEGTASMSSYAEEVEQFLDQGVEALYLVGGALDSGIFLRQARQMGASFDVVSSDTLVSQVFLQAAGEAAEGVPFTFPPEAVRLRSAAPAVEAIKALGFEPAGYTLLAYAATQVWIAGVERAQSFEAGPVALALRQAPIPTILGEIAFDEKGDIITPYAPFAWYVWKDGTRVPAD